MTKDISNPYDFGSPVKSLDKFADREEERREINEYLELSKGSDPSYYHLALTGSRASGKTSLVNITEKLSDEKDFLPVKIPLNEDLVETDVEFFTEIIDTIMTEGVKRGMYGGARGKTYRKFRKLIDTLDFEVQFDLPFNFASAYIGSKQSGNVNTISQRVLTDDLEELRNEAQDAGIPTIVILLDECDLLAENKAILQKLRNIFTDIEGYILVLSGTEDMFPDLSDTFSPLPRSFVNIKVDPFEDIEDTEECVKKPLDPEEEELVSRRTIRDLHRITGGSPYEINLICHHMYKRYNRGEKDNIILSREVLDDVLTEIERLRKEGHHKIADAISNLSDEELKVLISLHEFPEAPEEWVLNYSLLDSLNNGGKINFDEVKERNRDIINNLESLGIVESNDELVTFAGSQFDSLYLRYYVASLDHLDRVYRGGNNNVIRTIAERIREILFNGAENPFTMTKIDEVQPPRGDQTIRPQPRGTHFGMGFGSLQNNRVELNIDENNFTLKTGNTEINAESIQSLFQYGHDQAVRYRCHADWLGAGFTQLVFLPSDVTQKEFNSRLSELSSQLGDSGYEIYFVDETVLMRNSKNAIKNGELREAEEALKNAIEMSPNSLTAYIRLAWVKCELGELEPGLELIDKVINNFSDINRAIAVKGCLLLRKGRQEQGLEMIKSVTDEENTDYSAWRYAVPVLRDEGLIEEAESAIDRLIASTPDEERDCGFKLATLVDIDEPEKMLEYANKIDTEDFSDFEKARVQYHIACAEAVLGNVDDATEVLKEAFEISPVLKRLADDDVDLDPLKAEGELEEIKPATD